MKRFVLISPKNRTVYNFRGDLIKEIQAGGYAVTVTGPDRDNIDRILELGVDFIEIPMNKTGTSICKDLKYLFSLIKVLKSVKPDAVLGYTIKPVVYGAIAAKKAGVKNINCMVTGGGYTFTSTSLRARMLGKIVRMLYRYGLAKADHIIFQNRDDMDEFKERKLIKHNRCYIVNGSGVNTDYFKRVPYPDVPAFFMLSRFLNSKGVREYLEAAALVKKQYPSAKFYILGKYEDGMQDAIPKEYIEPFIKDGIVCRFDETDDVRPYYGMCSVYVLPSYREGTPRTVLEAMAMGRPVITTDTQGCRETVKDGQNGFLVPVKDSAAVADKMKWFLEHPDSIPKMGEEAYKYAREKYDVKIVNADMIRYMEI